MKKLILLSLLLSSCASNKVYDCVRINGLDFCHELSEEEQNTSCASSQKAMDKGWEVILPPFCHNSVEYKPHREVRP